MDDWGVTVKVSRVCTSVFSFVLQSSSLFSNAIHERNVSFIVLNSPPEKTALEMHSIWTLSSEEDILTQVAMTMGSWSAFSMRYFTVYVDLLSKTGPLFVLLSLGVIYILYYLYLLSRPLNLISDLTGERSDRYFRLPAKNDAMAKEHFRSRLQQERGSGKLPIYPNGWFGILESSEIGRNEVKYVTALGENFAVFRGSDGKVHVVNACCIHLRGDVDVEGTPRNDCLECPSHGWQFSAETENWKNIPRIEKGRRKKKISGIRIQDQVKEIEDNWTSDWLVFRSRVQ
nr:PREDICTED: cholesterol 7-desaturase-like [Bemisia tabaci]